jgi:hypothetical protein
MTTAIAPIYVEPLNSWRIQLRLQNDAALESGLQGSEEHFECNIIFH